jgi:hypothetical protein
MTSEGTRERILAMSMTTYETELWYHTNWSEFKEETKVG